MTGLLLKLGMAGILGAGSAAFAANANVDLTGRLRVVKVGGRYLIHVDVKNSSSNAMARGPSVRVRLKDRHGTLITEQTGLRLYPYLVGAAATAGIKPKHDGYIPLYLPTAGVDLSPGTQVNVKISGEGQSNFGTDTRNATTCQKGTPNCL